MTGGTLWVRILPVRYLLSMRFWELIFLSTKRNVLYRRGKAGMPIWIVVIALSYNIFATRCPLVYSCVKGASPWFLQKWRARLWEYVDGMDVICSAHLFSVCGKIITRKFHSVGSFLLRILSSIAIIGVRKNNNNNNKQVEASNHVVKAENVKTVLTGLKHVFNTVGSFEPIRLFLTVYIPSLTMMIASRTIHTMAPYFPPILTISI